MIEVSGGVAKSVWFDKETGNHFQGAAFYKGRIFSAGGPKMGGEKFACLDPETGKTVYAVPGAQIRAPRPRLAGAEGWNDLDAISKRVTITHDTTGQYQISCDATYPDWSDTERPVEFHGAWITPIGSTSVRPPTFTLDNATQITVYTWNASGSATDMAFSLKIW